MPNTIKCTKTFELGILDHLLVYASVKNKVKRPPPKVVIARSYKRFDNEAFRKDVEEALWAVISVFDDPDDSYWAWSHLFNEICDRHAPYRQVKIRQQSLPWITPQIRHLMNLRLKTFLKAKKSNSQELWSEYRSLRNRVTQEVRLSKSEYYTNLFDEVKDCRSYWKLVKSSSGSRTVQPILGIRGNDQIIETSDSRKAFVNEYFSTIGEKLASELYLDQSLENSFSYITRVTPTVTNIDFTYDSIMQDLIKLKHNKTCGPDNIAPRLLKSAGHALIPSLFSLYSMGASCNTVPSTWKFARVSALFKKDDETDKQNYRPISLLCVPGKLMETQVVSTITNHVEHHNLRNKHQWVYKKGHFTQLLLAKMTEDWRRALDRKLIVGVVFIDFRKAFDSLPHNILLYKLQSLGIAGDLWCWTRDYLMDRHQATVVNGCKSESMPVRFGVPQGSRVLFRVEYCTHI